MRSLRGVVLVMLLAAAVLPLAASQCQIQYISHGTFRDVGGCLVFEDLVGDLWEVARPRGAWQDGMTGTMYAELDAPNACSDLPTLNACRFDADFTRNVTGTLFFVNFVECPGFIIHTNTQDYLITNCEDWGEALCSTANIHRKIKVEVFVDTGISICLGTARSSVLAYRFLD